MKRISVKISNRMTIFYSNSRDMFCMVCEKNISNQYVLSSPHNRYRCLECAIRLHIIEKIPKEIEEVMLAE